MEGCPGSSAHAKCDQSPVILTVRAHDAWAAGVAFYAGNDKVWLADHVPPAFLAGRP